MSNVVLSLSYFILGPSGDSTYKKDDNRIADIASPNLTSLGFFGREGVEKRFQVTVCALPTPKLLRCFVRSWPNYDN